MLKIQKGFWQDAILANVKQKLAELHQINPSIAESEKRAILEFWKAYDGLADVLEDKFSQFIAWFFNATPSETITRCLRALKEDGTIRLSQDQIQKRQEQENLHREYWRHNGE